MNQIIASKNLKGTWNQAILTFLFPILLVLALRWAIVEPFVIPSGSMIPSLLIHDHILVKKYSFGLRWPFSDHWLIQWEQPQRGDILVFKYPENPEVFYIKRLVGLPGDEIRVQDGRIAVNGKPWFLEPYQGKLELEPGFNYYNEFIKPGNQKNYSHVVRFMSPETISGTQPQTFVVPPGMFFFMGDNRDQSSDSRIWGFVKNDYIVGKAWLIWLSCESTLPSMTFVCDPAQLRFSRLIQFLD